MFVFSWESVFGKPAYEGENACTVRAWRRLWYHIVSGPRWWNFPPRHLVWSTRICLNSQVQKVRKTGDITAVLESHISWGSCMHLAVFRYPGSVSSHSGVKYIEFKISPSGFWELIPSCRLTADFSYQAFLDAWCLLSRLYAMLWAVHQTWMTMKRFLCNYTDGLYLDFVLLMNTCYCCQQTRVMDTCMQKIAAVI